MKYPSSYITAFLLLFLLGVKSKCQSYHAFSGSPYAGVNAMYNNPASTVNSAFNWDVTLFSMQASIANTLFVIKNNSVTSANKSSLFITEGTQPRYFTNNLDINLLNFRVKIDHKSAFAVGMRLREYTNIVARPFAYSDTISTLQGFLQANNTTNYLDGSLTHAGWAEFNFNYSRILVQKPAYYLSAGITLSYMKGLSGAFAQLSNVSYADVQTNTGSYYNLLQAGATAEYSANYQVTNNNNTTAENVKTFIKGALPSIGVDIGAEYLFKDYSGADDEAVNATNYDWKIGVSIMDIGRNKFNPIPGSFSINTPNQNITDTALQRQLQGVANIQDVKDTLQKLFIGFDSLHNRFNISLPTRMVISVDRNFGSHFYVNGEASLNFYSTKQTGSLKTGELNLLTITPRWETSAWGLYLPVQYNIQGLLWVGAAIKLGPLLVGVHNLDFIKWFKTGTQTYNGGGYILLSVHPFEHKKEEDKLPCPKV